jgi:hypothetical protein
MNRRRIAIIATSAAVAALGTGAAIGATSRDDARQAEREVLADAADRLGTSPDELREALSEAFDARLDQAVQDGRLTQEQADAIKERRAQHGGVLGMGPGGPGHRGGPPFGARGRGGPMADVAAALGITERRLFRRLRDGDSLAEIARAQGKSRDDVRAAVRRRASTRLDRAVASGRITRGQADEMLEHLDEHLERLGDGRHPGPPHRGHGRGPGHGFGPPPGMPGGP